MNNLSKTVGCDESHQFWGKKRGQEPFSYSGGSLFAGLRRAQSSQGERDGRVPIPADWYSQRGVALVLTLVVLVVLTTIVYALASRVAQVKHRRQFLIDYQISRYACDSAVKYALTAIKEMDFTLIDRKDKPDFSDVFTMDRAQYEQYLDEWALKLANQDSGNGSGSNGSGDPFDLSGFDPNIVSDPNFLFADYTEPNAVSIPGPYGPEWPYVRDPIRFDIGQTHITIEIVDENAKMPLVWPILDNDKDRKLALDALDMFGAWMQMDPVEIRMLSEQLEDIEDIKRFTTKPKPIRVGGGGRKPGGRGEGSPRGGTLPITTHNTDFAKLLHGSAIDLYTLARPLPDTGDRHESPLKYLALWGSGKVNINTAPRHVLEAAFTFGGDAEDIAEEIIQRRHEKPFRDIKDLEDSLYRYSESIKKSKDYITTSSMFFTIKVTAAHGRARTRAVATVIKLGKRVRPIAVIAQL
jgi:hypothetical protein